MGRTGTDSPVLGIVAMVAGLLFLTIQDAVSKWLVASLHVGEIMAWRGLFALPLVLLLVRLERDRWETLRSRAPRQSALRAVLAFFTAVLVVLSYKVMPLADAMAIIFVSPLLVTALSAVLLKEPVGWRRWLAACAGFAGALLIAGPSFDTIGMWALTPVAAALASALSDIATRRLGRIDTGPSILFWTLVVATLGGFASVPVFGWSTPSPTEWALLLAAAVLLLLAYRLNIAAYTLASGAIVAPLRYLAVVWGGVIGYLVWGHVPDARAVAGAVLVMGAGLYIWRREVRLAKIAASPR